MHEVFLISDDIYSSWLAQNIQKFGSGQIEYPKNQRSPLEILFNIINIKVNILNSNNMCT